MVIYIVLKNIFKTQFKSKVCTNKYNFYNCYVNELIVCYRTIYTLWLHSKLASYILNDSPHPHVPFMLGLLNTNSELSLFST